MSHVDGNALAGMLADIFVFDATTARARCVNCGDIGVLAGAMVYGGEQGHVVRCVACDSVLMVVLPEPHAVRVQMRGIAWLEVGAA